MAMSRDSLPHAEKVAEQIKNYVACHMAPYVLAYAANNLIWKTTGNE